MALENDTSYPTNETTSDGVFKGEKGSEFQPRVRRVAIVSMKEKCSRKVKRQRGSDMESK
jgi:hypothetical protein